MTRPQNPEQNTTKITIDYRPAQAEVVEGTITLAQSKTLKNIADQVELQIAEGKLKTAADVLAFLRSAAALFDQHIAGKPPTAD